MGATKHPLSIQTKKNGDTWAEVVLIADAPTYQTKIGGKAPARPGYRGSGIRDMNTASYQDLGIRKKSSN